MATEGRTYTPRERRLLSEFLSFNYPRARVITNVRLGPYPLQTARPLPPNVPATALSSFRRYADAIVIEPAQLTIIEAKIINAPVAVADLLLYKRLLPMTPDLAQYIHLPVRLLIVAAINDPILEQIAQEQGITTITFTPSWVYDDLMQTSFNTRPPLIKKPVPLPSGTTSG